MNQADPVAIQHIWAAVDRITKPEHAPIPRADETLEAWLRGPLCDIAAHHRALVNYGIIPSLWDQASNALIGAEHDNTGPGGDPAERNPCDIDLMEIRGIIRDTTTHELARLFRIPPSRVRPPGNTPAQLRRLASTAITQEPDQLWWWEYRFASWGRLLATYLGAVDRVNRARWLRNSPCPKCGATGVLVESDHDTDRKVWVPALVVDFRDGYVRATTCQACAHTWFRGEQLHELAKALNTPKPAQVAETA